ncbi:hypothetical protein B0H63DRAFT_197881 [Podospora didyma]|uniref:F-box domain-containing protein n=1 Tax=Podospora didyma TaxID=330526 RepID=A0AAE0NGQ0_9PEZI|nr:hypothetical protein B0H63DRAFT_197881 [Podospora didyma]
MSHKSRPHKAGAGGSLNTTSLRINVGYNTRHNKREHPSALALTTSAPKKRKRRSNPSSSMAILTDLAAELIEHILSFVDPTDHLNVALVCRKIANHAQHVLLQNQRWHRANSDILPSTMPKILRALLRGDRMALWHIRDIELWGARQSWDEWKPFELVRPHSHAADEDLEIESPGARPYGPGFFSQAELGHFHHLMREDLGLSVRESEAFRQAIERGCDQPIKALVIAFSPRLRCVNIVKYRQRLLENHGNMCLLILAESIRSILDHPNQWTPPLPPLPCGLASIKRLAIGVQSRALPAGVGYSIQVGGVGRDRYLASYRTFMYPVVPFFKLPNLESIYISGLSDPPVVTDRWDFHMPKGCSGVRDIVIDSPHFVTNIAICSIIKACKRSLRTLVFHGQGFMNVFDCAAIPQAVSECHDKVEAMLFCEDVLVQSSKWKMFEADSIPKIPIYSVCMRDVMVSGYGDGGEGDAAPISPSPGSITAELFADFFAESMGGKAIVFLGTISETEMEVADDAIVHLLDLQHRGVLRRPPLRALYLEGLEKADPAVSGVAKKRWFEKAIRAGKRFGVEVHTRSTRAPRKHSVEFPEITGEKDLKSSPWFEHPDVEKTYFKPHRGLVNDCGNCGACRVCFKFYPEELWKAWAEEGEL